MVDRGPVPVGTGSAVEPRLSGVVGAGALAALLFGFGGVVPALAPLAIASPLPLAIQRVRGGAVGAWLAAVLAAALVAAAASPGPALVFLLALAAPGILLGESLARGRGLLRGCGWAFGLLVLEVATALLFAGDAIARQTLSPFDRLRSPEVFSQLRTNGMSEEALTAFGETLETWHAAVAVVFPAVWIIFAAVVVMANAGLLRFYLLRRDPGWLEDGEFERVRFPLGLVGIFILAGAAVALPAARPFAYNALLIVAFFFALQGLAVVAFYARRLAVPALLRVALLVLVLANPWSQYILALLGLFDNWFDFRRWAEPPREKV